MGEMNFTKHDVSVIIAELTATHECVQELITVREIATFHTLDQINHLWLLEKLAAWRRTNGFDRSKVLAERQHRSQGHVYLVDDS